MSDEMNKTQIGLLVLTLAIFGFGYLAYANLFQSKTQKYTLNYKMTVVVETPEGIKTGSSVKQIIDDDYHGGGLPAVTSPPQVKGEATVIDLGERGTIFALVSDTSDREFFEAFKHPFHTDNSYAKGYVEHYRDLPIGAKSRFPLDVRYGRPKFVMFKDMSDAKSVVAIPYDDFASVLGQGVKLKEILIEVTDEAMTDTRILENLPKFDDEFWKWRRALQYGDPRRISPSEF